MKTNRNTQVISKQRVADHGEVLTAEREVNAMLDLVKPETQRIDSRFLEPACGTGNFLVAILHRKLDAVTERYTKSPLEYMRYAFIALSSLYGIDILQDNVVACRARLRALVLEKHTDVIGMSASVAGVPAFQDYCLALDFLLSKNIIWGDALTLQPVDGTGQPIVFAEWAALNGNMLKRRDFAFTTLVNHASQMTLPLFAKHEGEKYFAPVPIREYPVVHYLKIKESEL